MVKLETVGVLDGKVLLKRISKSEYLKIPKLIDVKIRIKRIDKVKDEIADFEYINIKKLEVFVKAMKKQPKDFKIFYVDFDKLTVGGIVTYTGYLY